MSELLIPNTAAPRRRGMNGDTPLALLGGEAYRLTLYDDLAGTKGVLVVSMTVQFQFADGEDGEGNALVWTAAEKSTFTAGFARAVKEVWDNKFRLTTTSSIPDR